MFEQSILGDDFAGRKAVPFFASLGAQITAIGVLIVVPLLFHQALPVFRLSMPLVLPFSQPPPIAVERGAISRAAPRVFQAPARILPLTTPTAPGEPLVESVPPSLTPGPLPESIGRLPAAMTIPLPDFPKPPQTAVRPAPAPQPRSEAVQVGGEVQAAKILRRVMPVYPVLARQARISGTVRLLGVIAKDGSVQKLQVLSGHPLLVRAAIDAVKQWQYRPTVLDGDPVEVIAPINVIFTLSQ